MECVEHLLGSGHERTWSFVGACAKQPALMPHPGFFGSIYLGRMSRESVSFNSQKEKFAANSERV